MTEQTRRGTHGMNADHQKWLIHSSWVSNRGNSETSGDLHSMAVHTPRVLHSKIVRTTRWDQIYNSRPECPSRHHRPVSELGVGGITCVGDSSFFQGSRMEGNHHNTRKFGRVLRRRTVLVAWIMLKTVDNCHRAAPSVWRIVRLGPHRFPGLEPTHHR